MRQLTLASQGSFEKYRKKTRREEFLEEMDRIMPWAEFESLIAPYYPKAGNGRPPIGLGIMLRIYFLQHWFNLSDPAAEEALYDSAALRRFAGVDLGRAPAPDETTILNFRHLLEQHDLCGAMLDAVNGYLNSRGIRIGTGTIVDATIIHAPSSTKNASGARDPEMHQTRKGNQWYFGMKAHIGVDADSGLVHSVEGTAANVNDVTQAHKLLHGEEDDAFGDAGYQGVQKRPEAKADVNWHVAMKPGKRKALDLNDPAQAITDKIERVKASIRAKVEHPFRVVKKQFGHVKVRYRGLAKNTAQIKTLFMLSNLWMVRGKLMAGMA